MSSLIAEDDQTWLPTTVQVTVLRGRGLRAKGKHGTSDVYTIIQLGKEKYSTMVAEKTTEPEWREECCFELQPGALQGCSPPPNTDLVFTVMHRALIGMDVFMGQVMVRLHEVFQESHGAKNQWFRLNSKTGKKEKERGEIQVSIQFTRNNLTASMYDLVMKDKSASTFSKLKEHMKGKRRSNNKDSSSAVLPGGYGFLYRMRQRLPSDGGGEEDYEDDEGGEARRSKMRTFFLRGKLRKSSDTRSSSSLGSESSESSSRGGSLSPTAGISVVVSDLSNSPSNSSNLTADNSPDHIANRSPNSSSLQCAFGDEASEISISVPPHTVCVNRSHTYTVPPLDLPSGHPTDSFSPGLLHKFLPLSTSLQNISSSAADPIGDVRRWSFDKLSEKEKAAITVAVEKSGLVLSDEHQEGERWAALPKSSNLQSECWDRKQRRNRFGNVVYESAGKVPHTIEGKHTCWLGSKDLHNKPSTHLVKPLTSAMLMEERRSVLATGLEKLKFTIQPGWSSQNDDPDANRKKPLTDGAGLYDHLTHNELVSLLVQREEDLHCQKLHFERQKMVLAKREWELQRLKPQVRDLEDYIDRLLVRIMEQKPNLLQVRSKFK